MKKCIGFVYVIFVFGFFGNSCQSTRVVEKTDSSFQTNEQITIPTKIPLTTIDATTSPDPVFLCWPVKPLVKGNSIQGGFLIASFPYRAGKTYANSIYYWDMNTFKSTPVKIAPHKLAYDEQGFISPDGKMLAFPSENQLIIISDNNLRSFPFPDENLKIRTFLPNGQILLDHFYQLADYYQEGKGLTNIFYLFDPLSGESTKYSAFLPNFVMGKNTHFWTLLYSPNMKYILYRSSPDDYNIQFSLFDLEKNKVLWVGPSHPSDLNNYYLPGWQPDSRALTIIYRDKSYYDSYYSISLNGKVTTMNNFNGADLYGPTSSPIWRVEDPIGFPNWSPNGRYLASTGYINKISTGLFIWDTEENTLNRPCLPDEDKRSQSDLYLDWSFDREHAIISLVFIRSATPREVSLGIFLPDYSTKTYILDFVDKVLYEFPDLADTKIFPQYQNSHNARIGWVNW
ncbi:MAG: hypothetical protein AB9891_12110 [Anaerolineaceae bacterium]